MSKRSGSRWMAALLGFMLAACSEVATPVPAQDANTAAGGTVQTFEGFYAAGREMSSFVPCAMREPPGSGKGYWLIPNAEFSRMYEEPTGISILDIAGTYGPDDVFAIYVRFEGTLSAEPGKAYGHLGLYRGQVQVTKTFEVSRRWVGSTHPEPVFIGCGR